MAYEYYYPKTLRSVSYSVLNMLKDAKCIKYNSSGTPIEDIEVPLAFNQPEKTSQFLAQSHWYSPTGIEVGNRYYQQFPRASLILDGISYAPERVTASNETREWLAASLELNGPDATSIFSDVSPVPYDISYTYMVRTDSLDYMSQILENLLPWFNPNRNLRIKEFSFLNIERDLNVTLTGITPTVTMDIAETDRRIVAVDAGIKVEAFFYRPIKSEKIIKLIESKYFTIDNIDDLS